MTTEELKRNLTITEVIDRYGIKTDRKGFCKCPFHMEKTASMKIYPKSNSFYCFGCGQSGDIFKFVQLIDNCDFKTAFISLGGTYEKQTDNARMVANMKRERAKKEAERREQDRQSFKEELNFCINLLKATIKIYEPMSDEWTFAQNNLPVLFEYGDSLTDGEENTEDAEKRLREIRRYFDLRR